MKGATIVLMTPLCITLLCAAPALAGDKLRVVVDEHVGRADLHEIECRAALDRLDDLVSDPGAALYLTTAATAGLARELALCRTGRADHGGALLRKTFATIHPAD